MPTSPSRQVEDLARFGRLWWLPAGGQGNGVDDQAWAPILDVDPEWVGPVLAALASAGVAGYAAPYASRRRLSARDRSRPPTFRIWVGSSRHSVAEDVLMAVLPKLDRRFGRDGVR